MRALLAQEMLDVWEQGFTQPLVARALTLLAAASPEMSRDALMQLSLGERNARLLTLREWAFGSRITGMAACPACGEKLELEFSTADIRAQASNEHPELQVDVGDYRVRFRLPNSADMLGANSQDSLLNQCLVSVDSSNGHADANSLSAPVVDAIAERMAQADPQANVQLALTCPNCNHVWQAAFDIVSYFWTEINAWAIRILREVHTLARAYGWREADILALSPQRRQIYLNLVGA